MLYDHRTYTCKPGTLQKHIALYVQHGYGPHSRQVGLPVLFAVTDIGDVNSYVHVWAYDSMEDRSKKRAALWADPDWLAYVALSREAGYLTSQESRLLQAVLFPDNDQQT